MIGIVLAITLPLISGVSARTPEPIDYKGEMNHADAMYRIGEKAVLTDMMRKAIDEF